MDTRHYKRHKYKSIDNWKRRGVISDDFDKLYEHHMNINNCKLCDIEFNKGEKMERRCLDHDHATGLYRQTICYKCNCQFDKQQYITNSKKYKNNKSGHKNISFVKRDNLYQYHKLINGKKISKRFKTLRDTLVYKFIQILKINLKNKF